MGYLYDRWQSDSALVQGCTKRAEAYACTLQIVVPLADRASCAKGDPTTVTTSGRGGKGLGASFCSRFLIYGAVCFRCAEIGSDSRFCRLRQNCWVAD